MSDRGAEIAPGDIIREAKISRLGYTKTILLKSFLEQRKNSVRTKALGRLVETGAQPSYGARFAVFDSGTYRVGELNSPTRSRLEVLIMAYEASCRRQVAGQSLGCLRIVTNESFWTSEEDGDIMTEDFTLDGADDAQYNIDVTDDEEADSSTSPVFDLDGHLFGTINLRTFTPAMSLPDTPSISPFGNYRSVVDTLYAVNAAEAILGRIVDIPPRYMSVSRSGVA